MSRLVEFPLESGETVVVEVEDGEVGLQRAGRGEIAERASETFEGALEKIKPAAGVIIAKLRSLADTPDEVNVEFGIKLSGKLGVAFVASADAEANYKVTLKWSNTAPAPAAAG
jgi:hypothetical protein